VLSLKNDQAEIRSTFGFARKMGVGTITAEPEADAFDTLETLVREYDIKIAIHNHPRRVDHADYRMWDLNYVLELVQNRDARIGACADTGHWARSGIHPVEALQILQGRVVSSHLKDLNEFAPEGDDVPFGSGVCEVARVLGALKEQNFDGPTAIEYEHNWENSVPEVAQCIDFVRENGAR
jgi:sugar phosphate isomerase/epimerase